MYNINGSDTNNFIHAQIFADGKKFTIEPVKVRHRRLVDQNVNSLHVKKKINVKCPEKTMAGSNENDSSLPNKETVKSVVDEFKPIKVESTDIEMPLNVNKIEFSNCMINVSCTPKDEENIKSNSNTNNIIYSEHSYTTFGLKCSESSIVSPHDRVVDMPVKKYIEDPAVEVCLHSDSGTFVAAETLCDMVCNILFYVSSKMRLMALPYFLKKYHNNKF